VVRAEEPCVVWVRGRGKIGRGSVALYGQLWMKRQVVMAVGAGGMVREGSRSLVGIV